jgi:hypothetical protein
MRRGSSFERGLCGVVVNALKRTRSSRLSTDLPGWRRGKKADVKGKEIENKNEAEAEAEAEAEQERNKGTFHNLSHSPISRHWDGYNSHTMISEHNCLIRTVYSGITKKKIHEFSLDYANTPNSSHLRHHSQK